LISGEPAIIAENPNAGNEIGEKAKKLDVIAGSTRNPWWRATMDPGSSPG
jgi:hypothetical protein